MHCSLDGAVEVDCPLTGYAVTGLADGVHALELHGWDAAGNDSRALVRWEIDTRAPDARIVHGPDASTTDTTASFAAASEPGAHNECSLDGARFTACSDTVAYGGLAVGAHTFEVRATDAPGNVDQTPARHQWTVTAPPAAPAINTAAATTGARAAVLPRVVWRAVANKRFTRITALSVEDLTAAAKATVSCKGKGCKLRKKVVPSKPGAKRLDLSRLLRKGESAPGRGRERPGRPAGHPHGEDPARQGPQGHDRLRPASGGPGCTAGPTVGYAVLDWPSLRP